MFNSYKIIRNNKGQFIMHTTFWKATKYHMRKVWNIISLSTLTALILISTYTLGQHNALTSNVAYAQNIVTYVEANNFPILDKIATCESHGKQFRANGTLVTNVNKNGTIDIGKYEINSIHEALAVSLGYNIYTEEGNHDFALYLFKHYGSEPWSSSKHCWSKSIK